MGKKVEGPHEGLTYRIIGAAMAVHRRIRPGEKEHVYQKALEAEFVERGIAFEAERNLPVYDGDRLLGFYIPDLIVEDKVIVELKAFASLHEKYRGQVITYLNHTGLSIGLLLNFGEPSLHPHRIFPSTEKVELEYSYRWLFVPDWLKLSST